jgi:hypothetical protein
MIESKLAVSLAITAFGSRGQQGSGYFTVMQELTNIMNGFREQTAIQTAENFINFFLFPQDCKRR